MSGSRPDADVVTKSTGTGVEPFSALSLSTSPFTRSINALLVGPRFEPEELAALYGCGTVFEGSAGSAPLVADGRPWKYLPDVNDCPMSSDPMTLPSRTIRLPCDCFGKMASAMPVMASG